MSRREDFKKILNHEQPDNLILDLGGNPLSSMEGKSPEMLMDYLGYDYDEPEKILFGKTHKIDERVLNYLDIDTRSVGTILTPLDSQFEMLNEKEYIDEWGIKRVFTGMYWDMVDNPLKGATIDDLKDFKWPDANSIDMKKVEQYAKKAKDLYENTDYIICAEHPVYGVFELGCWMCGFDDYLLKMAIDQDFVKYFSEKVLEYQKVVTKLYYSEVGKYIHYTSSGDDFATQSNLFISKTMFQDLIKPYLKERISVTKQYTDAAFLHHSCGCVHDIIDDLIDCGVEILNPIQPVNDKMSPKLLKDEFGEEVVFHGGLDTQAELPFGNEQSVTKAVNELVDIMNKNGGYIFAAAHNIQEDVPPENVVHMFKAARKAGKK